MKRKIAIRATVGLIVCVLVFWGCSEQQKNQRLNDDEFVVMLETEAETETETETDVEVVYCKHDNPSQIVVVEAEAPTCHKVGLTEGMKCNLCGVMIVPQIIVPTIECIRSRWIVGKAATKTNDGYEYIECTMCSNVLEKKVIHAGSQGLSYSERIDGTSCGVSGMGKCRDVDLIIPSMYRETPITRIDDQAFCECTSLLSIVIPEGVISIGDRAFWRCSALESITIPHSVWRIDGVAFYGCTSLSNIYFNGTKEEWNSIGKNTGWNTCSNKVTIYCTDGEISN